MNDHVGLHDSPTAEHACGDREPVKIGPIGIDDWGDVRYVHTTAFRTLAAPHLEPDDARAFAARVGEAAYADELMHANLIGAWLDGELVGTAGWVPASDGSSAARIVGLFVRPLFTYMGIGTRLLMAVEEMARAAGYGDLTAYATAGSVPFFEAYGYSIAGYSRVAVGDGREAAVIVMRNRATAPLSEPAIVIGGEVTPRGVLTREPMPFGAPGMAPDTGLIFGEIPERT